MITKFLCAYVCAGVAINYCEKYLILRYCVGVTRASSVTRAHKDLKYKEGGRSVCTTD